MILSDRNHDETIIGTLFTVSVISLNLKESNGQCKHSRRGKNYTEPLGGGRLYHMIIPRRRFHGIQNDPISIR